MAAALPNADGDSRLRVEFCWHGDRYAHVIWLETSTVHLAILSSIEGDPVNAWPPSPSLTQCDQITLADQRQAWALLGMAGSSHWSLSVEPTTCARAWNFDIACRLRTAQQESGSWLGSTYAPAPGWRVLAESQEAPPGDTPQRLPFSAASGSSGLIPAGWRAVARLAPVDPSVVGRSSQLAVILALPPAVQAETAYHILPDGNLQLFPTGAPGTGRQTCRWRYLIGVESLTCGD